ncbi:CBO0543 family protein [Neobacillus niacini]|uniref:CBO0543 family protein n=1 Tax=Neobacillus niacini TaxID=86668 RepID=UPI0028587DA2|nr:CBO0543 family protein [Neobacillus niacini]MDR6997802.1 membrane-associated HD superfamily phosphohydrolase [Neobacillus niacini]
MMKEILILIFSWLLSISLMLKYIPKERKRTAHITFLFVSTITWIYEYIAILTGVVEFPFREFNAATKMSFSLYYIVYPTFGVFFIILYPMEKMKRKIFIHFFVFALAITTFTFLIDKYSSLIDFIKWNWFVSFFSNIIILVIVKKFLNWFKKELV